MTRESIEEILLDYETNRSASFDSSILNTVRNDIFVAESKLEFDGGTRIVLLKRLYAIADDRGVYYMNIINKKSPETEEEDEISLDEEDYEDPDSYSLDPSWDEDEDDDI